MAMHFKIQLENITNPPVWRKLVVPEHFTFRRLHHVIQAAFGWTNSHLFQFSPLGFGSHPEIGIPLEENDILGEEQPLDAARMKLPEIFTKARQKFTYIYDFGDSWTHLMTLEKITPEKIKRADCVDGKGACPPEDCGSTYGYADLKKIMANPKNPEHEGMRIWLGLGKKKKWDAAAFDLEKTRKKVGRV